MKLVQIRILLRELKEKGQHMSEVEYRSRMDEVIHALEEYEDNEDFGQIDLEL